MPATQAQLAACHTAPAGCGVPCDFGMLTGVALLTGTKPREEPQQAKCPDMQAWSQNTCTVSPAQQLCGSGAAPEAHLSARSIPVFARSRAAGTADWDLSIEPCSSQVSPNLRQVPQAVRECRGVNAIQWGLQQRQELPLPSAVASSALKCCRAPARPASTAMLPAALCAPLT